LWLRTNTSFGTSTIIAWFGLCDYLTLPELKIFMNGPNFKLLEEILRSDCSCSIAMIFDKPLK
jgi:hypothetical protein